MKLPKISFNWLMRQREHPTVGVDIGSHSIKMVEFAGSGGQRVVRKVGRARLPQDSIVDGNIRDVVAISEALKTLVDNLQPRVKRATVSIAGYSVIAKRISVPYEDEKEIETNLLEEAENHVPFEVEDLYLDFHVIGPATDRGQGTEIFLAAAKREVVDTFANIIQEAGLLPSVVDVDGYALVNSFEDAHPEEEGMVVLIDIGAQKTSLNVVKMGQSLFSRDMSFGGSLITESIQEATGMSLLEAERIKIEGTDDPGLQREVGEICVEICTLWAQEVAQALDFFKGSVAAENEVPSKIYMSGGSSLFKGLDRIFARETGLDVARHNPLADRNLDGSIEKEYIDLLGPQFAIASGLALRTA